MKNILVTFVFAFSTISAFAQSESVKPTFGVAIEREVSYASIDNKDYYDIIVELKSAELGDIFAEGVKVVVRDNTTGKKIYKKNSPNHIFMRFQIEQ